MNIFNNFIISVESRKGGVGKTTAALNLAKIVLEDYKYAVLLLDTDITGTNTATSKDSPFWKDFVNVVNINDSESKSNHPVNLLSIFDKNFMSGRSLPSISSQDDALNSFLMKADKVNIVGSQLYNLNDNKNKYYCSPSILFDELHSYWFLEYIETICECFRNFATSNNKGSVIILDNSPGFVGLTPRLHDWLTTIGPERGKFLFVSSLDQQDIISTFFGLDELHNTYVVKYESSKKFNSIRNVKSGINLSGNEKVFFYELLKTCNSPNKKKYSFFLNQEDKNVEESDPIKSNEFFDHKRVFYKNNPQKYISLFFNRVPNNIKSGDYDYYLSNFINELEQCKVYTKYIEKDNKLPHDLMVRYNLFLEYQFTDKNIKNNKLDTPQKLASLLKDFEILAQNLEQQMDKILKEDLISGPKDSILIESPQKIFDWLHYCRLDYLNIVKNFRNKKFSDFKMLLQEKYEFHSTLGPLRNIAARLFNDEKQESIVRKQNRLVRVNSDEVRHLYKYMNDSVLQRLKEFFPDHMNENIYKFSGPLVTIICLLVKDPKTLFHSSKNILDAFVLILEIQLIRFLEGYYKYISPLSSHLYFNIIDSDYLNGLIQRYALSNQINNMGFLNNKDFIDFYNALSIAQSRLVGNFDNMHFLVTIVHYIIRTNINKPYLLNIISSLFDEVIIYNKLTPSEAESTIKKGISGYYHMAEFNKILTPILEEWQLAK